MISYIFKILLVLIFFFLILIVIDIKHYLLVSSVGANEKSSFLYMKTKGRVILFKILKINKYLYKNKKC